MDSGTPLVVDRGAARTKRIGGLGMVLLAAGLGYLATLHGFLAGMGAFVFGVAGLSLLAASFGFAGKGPCPSCGAEIPDVPCESEGVPCPGCGAYAIVKDAHLHRTPDDHVAGTSLYAVRVEVGQEPGFAPLCVSCGAPAAGSLPRAMSKTAASAPGVGRVVRKWTIWLPLCARHQTLDSLGNPPGVTSYEGCLMISSHRAWRQIRSRGAAPSARAAAR